MMITGEICKIEIAEKMPEQFIEYTQTHLIYTHWHMSTVVCDWSPSTRLKSCCSLNDNKFFFVNNQV